MNTTAAAPFSVNAPLAPSIPPAPRSRALKALAVVALVVVYLAWLLGIAIGWVITLIMAAEAWGGGWMYPSGAKAPFYTEAIWGITGVAFLLAFVFPALIAWAIKRRR